MSYKKIFQSEISKLMFAIVFSLTSISCPLWTPTAMGGSRMPAKAAQNQAWISKNLTALPIWTS
jgi:hypothetical protein